MGYQALLFCPDEKAARGVTQVLNELDFNVEPCTEPFAAVKKLMAQHFDAVVVDCDNEQNATLLFKSARNSASNQSSLAVAVVEGQAGVAKAFRIGANLVLTKPINIEQAKGTLRVARGLLRKGSDPAKPAAAPVPPTATSVPAAAKVPAPRPTPAASVAPAPTAPVKPVAASPKPPFTPRTSSDLSKDSSSRPEVAAQSAPPKVAQPAASASAGSAPSGPKKSYPWQPVKPGAEPMATAMRKAAEAAGVTTTEPTSSSAATHDLPPVASPGAGTATAVAPAKEKRPVESLPAEAVEPEITIEAKPAEVEPVVAPRPLAKVAEVEPPSFSMGAPAVDEEEPGSSKKALLIVAAVVILASLAGFLAWKNMSGKNPTVAPATVPGAQPGAAPTTGTATAMPSTPAGTGNASSVATEAPTPHTAESAAPTSKPSPIARSVESTKPTPQRDVPAPQEAPAKPAAPAIVVRSDTARSASKASASNADAEAPAPSALGMTTGGDARALAAIGSAPVSVPKASNQTVKVSQGVSEGLILKKVSPRYPSQALQMRLEGAVQLQATIGKDGSISNLKVVSGDAMLGRAAQDAVRQWKYKPYYLNGDPVEIQTQITVNFKLPR